MLHPVFKNTFRIEKPSTSNQDKNENLPALPSPQRGCFSFPDQPTASVRKHCVPDVRDLLHPVPASALPAHIRDFQRSVWSPFGSSFPVNNNRRSAAHLQPIMEDMKAKLSEEPVLHADETGFYFGGERNQLHTISTEKHSWYGPHLKRGSEAMEEMEIPPAYKGVLVHDFWKPYNEYKCSHALCNVHHLRGLTFCQQIEESSWAGIYKELLPGLYTKVRSAKENSATALSKGQRQHWSSKYDALMQEDLWPHPVAENQAGKRRAVKKCRKQNRIARFIAYTNKIPGFAKNFIIPFGNNIAEQAIRIACPDTLGMKVKQKISGCFRSGQGAKDFAIIRSHIATMKKQGTFIIQTILAANQPTHMLSSA